MGLFGFVALLLVASPLVAADDWWHSAFVNCYTEVLSIDMSVDTPEVLRAVRRVTSRTHPDRCKVRGGGEVFFVVLGLNPAA